MFHRDPIRNLRLALQHALLQDLIGVETAHRNGSVARRRPREQECDVVLFGQVWSGEALGCQLDPSVRQEHDTIVVIGPAQDACVYVSTALLYHVAQPNRRFYLDVAAHSMAPRSEAPSYEGHNDPVSQAVDIEVQAMLAKLLAQVTASEPHRAPLVASYLHRCAARFEQQQLPTLRPN